jgi:tetratricopeptide (TPR) repeat protein
MALLLEHAGQTAEAERWYYLVLEKAPKEEEARFRLGYLRLQREDYRGAAEAFEGCLKYRPLWPEAQANLALCHAGLGDRSHAERIYAKMLEADANSTDALRGLAAMAVQAGDFEAALEYHSKLIDLGERSAEVLYNAGLMHEKAGHADKAAALYRQALEQQPDMAEALLNLGRILETTGKPNEARACWTRALEAEPALAQGYFGPAID